MWPFQKHLDEATRREPHASSSGKMKFEVPPMCGLYRMQYHINDEKSASGGETGQEMASLPLANGGYEALKQKMDKELLSGSAYIDHFSFLSLSEAEPFACESCDVHIKTTRRTTGYQVVMRFARPVEPPKGQHDTSEPASGEETEEGTEGRRVPPWYTLFFPFSECGPKVESFQVQVNKFPVFGEVVRARRRDGRLVPSTEKAAFVAETSDLEDEKTREGEEVEEAVPDVPTPDQATEEKKEAEGDSAANTNFPSPVVSTEAKPTTARKATPLLYYYVVDPIHLDQILQLSATTGGATDDANWIEVEVAWRCRTDQLQGSTVYVPFSFYCAPRRPQRLTCHVELDKDAPPLKDVKSPSCQENLLYLNTRYLKDRRAAHVAVETVAPEDSIASVLSDKEDYFLFAVHLGENTMEMTEEVSFIGIAAIVIVLLLVVWFFLTKDLEF